MGIPVAATLRMPQKHYAGQAGVVHGELEESRYPGLRIGKIAPGTLPLMRALRVET